MRVRGPLAAHSRLGRDTHLYRVMLDIIITSILPSCSPAAQKSRGSWSLALHRIAHAFRFSVELILKLSFFTNLKKFKVRASIRCRIFYFLFLKFLKGIENEIIRRNVKDEVVARQIH